MPKDNLGKQMNENIPKLFGVKPKQELTADEAFALQQAAEMNKAKGFGAAREQAIAEMEGAPKSAPMPSPRPGLNDPDQYATPPGTVFSHPQVMESAPPEAMKQALQKRRAPKPETYPLTE